MKSPKSLEERKSMVQEFVNHKTVLAQVLLRELSDTLRSGNFSDAEVDRLRKLANRTLMDIQILRRANKYSEFYLKKQADEMLGFDHFTLGY